MAPTGKYSSNMSESNSELYALSSKQTLYSSKSTLPIDSERSTLASTVVESEQPSEITPWETGILNCIAKVRSFLSPNRRSVKGSVVCARPETATRRKQIVARMIREALDHASCDLVKRRAGQTGRAQWRTVETNTPPSGGESSESVGGISVTNIQSVTPDTSDTEEEAEQSVPMFTTLRLPQVRRTHLQTQSQPIARYKATPLRCAAAPMHQVAVHQIMRPKARGKFQCRRCKKICVHGRSTRLTNDDIKRLNNL